MGLIANPLFVEAQSTNSAGPSNRWLFIVETSRVMQGRAQAVREITAGLVGAGANSQLLPGDTLGLWTFNEALHAGGFPLQDITTPGSLQVAGRHVLEHLRKQEFSNAARLDRVMPQLLRLVGDSEFLTVILVTEGSSPIHGTPFDADINARFEAWRNQQAVEGMPFVTVLRAKGGVFTDYVVNTPPFPLEMPPLPQELAMPRMPKPVPVVETEKPAVRPMAQPLILSGRKPDAPTQAVTRVTEPAVLEPVRSNQGRPTPEITAVPPTNTVVTIRPAMTPGTSDKTNSSPTSNPITTPQSRTNIQENTSTRALASRNQAQTNVVKADPGSGSTPPLAASANDSNSTRLLVAASIGMTLGVVLFLVFRWRAAQRHHASLITRSLDRER